jgi:acetyl-CoA synthetase
MLATLEQTNEGDRAHVGREAAGEVVTKQPARSSLAVIDARLRTYSLTSARPGGKDAVRQGFLVSIAREVAYQVDVNRGDRVFFSTDMGWIMGPWTVVGAGAVGATVIYAEGAPDWPGDRLWETVESERVTMLGVSPTLIRALIPNGEPTQDLSSLQAILHDGRAVEPRSVSLAVRARGGGRVPIVNCPGAPRSARASSRRASSSRSSRSRLASPRSARTWTSSTLRDARCAARSASSCAGGPGRG